MRDSLFHVERLEATTLQNQIREKLVSAMLNGQLPPGSPVPSTRAMAERLRVSRNTVMLAYQALAADGYLVARERSGFYVSEEFSESLGRSLPTNSAKLGESHVDWAGKLEFLPSGQSNQRRAKNWHDYPYPFIYGQADEALFPIADWRDCSRQAMSRQWLDAWTDDRYTDDDPMLIEQIRQRLLTRRGISAASDEILVTLGAQNALYLIAALLVRPGTPVALEDPGYPDMRNIFELHRAEMHGLPVDEEGLCVEALGREALAFVTPSHQFPTNATMSLARRHALLDWAEAEDAIIIEDDYEFETNYIGGPTPALKSLDEAGRVLYVGSLSKSLMPGLRLGYLVGPSSFIREARALRSLILRHPPGNNQRVAALFLSLGRHDALIARLHKAYAGRWRVMKSALDKQFPGWSKAASFGGTSFWLQGPDRLDSRLLAEAALEDGIIIEPGAVYFMQEGQGKSFFRMGFSSIAEDRIAPGVERLAAVAARLG